LASSDLVVARAGATTLAEVACAGVAGVLVPYPFASDDHQRLNAAWYVGRGAARMVEEAEGGGEWVGRLAGELGLLLDSGSKRLELSTEMGRLGCPNAADEVVGVLAEMLGEPLGKWVGNPGVVRRVVGRAA
jgi:UDP-N-acetylglucosamine--N-acetylmuramyl-(pentapeptide) pyrophosphoryl-undecaprenol N-acetylglucosamine transferase